MYRTRRDMATVLSIRSRPLIRRKQANCTASVSSEVSVVYWFSAMRPILDFRSRLGERCSARGLGMKHVSLNTCTTIEVGTHLS